MSAHLSPPVSSSKMGFSLWALLPAIGCLSLLAGLTLNSGQHWLDERRALNDRLALAQMIEHAQIKSLLGNQTLTLCGSISGQTCSQEWKSGFLMIPHHTNGFINTPHYHRLQERVRLIGSTRTLNFRPEPAANILNATFIFCTPHGVGFPVIVNRVGRVKLLDGHKNHRCALPD